MSRRNPQNPRRMVKVGNVTYQSRRSAAKALGCLCSEITRAADAGGEIAGKPVSWTGRVWPQGKGNPAA